MAMNSIMQKKYVKSSLNKYIAANMRKLEKLHQKLIKSWPYLITTSTISAGSWVFCLHRSALLCSCGQHKVFGTKISWLLNIILELGVLCSVGTTYAPQFITIS